MKQKYVKPVVLLERFSLTECIANGCGADDNGTLGNPLNSSKAYCKWEVNGIELFLSNGAICNSISQSQYELIFGEIGEDQEIQGVCYNNPNGATVFGSI